MISCQSDTWKSGVNSRFCFNRQVNFVCSVVLRLYPSCISISFCPKNVQCYESRFYNSQSKQPLNNKMNVPNAPVINKDDTVISIGYFCSDSTALVPFYVWTCEEHLKAIHDLFSGRRVYFRADVTHGLERKFR